MKPRGRVSYHYFQCTPVEYAIIANWNNMEKIWHHTFYGILYDVPEEFFVLLTKVNSFLWTSCEKITTMMFETFSIFSMCSTQAILIRSNMNPWDCKSHAKENSQHGSSNHRVHWSACEVIFRMKRQLRFGIFVYIRVDVDHQTIFQTSLVLVMFITSVFKLSFFNYYYKYKVNIPLYINWPLSIVILRKL